MQDAAIVIEQVTKRFGDKVAVNKLDLVVPRGTVCGFLGPNGAGKTTTIRMVMSIIYPDSGSIRVLDKSSAAESKDRIGYLPEERGVYRKMKVGEFLWHMARLKGVPSAGLNQKIDGWLERVSLAEVRKKRCEQLSKGMQQKVQFLAAIIHDPELVILDEPFSGLDPVNARLLRTLIDEMHDEGRTIIFSTHVLHSAEQVCDRVFMINRGHKVLDGTIDAIRRRFDPKTVIVEPTDPGNGEVTNALASVSGVHSVTPPGARSTTFEAHLDDGVDTTGVVRSIVDRIAVQRVEVRRATLEDIFVQLVAPEDSDDSVRASISGDESMAEMEASVDA